MKYKAKYDKFESLSDDELLHKLLQERGIEDVNTFLNLDESVLKNTKMFENMERGLYLIDKYILNGGKICIIVDSDSDGACSGAFTYLELKKLNPDLDIKYILHKGKEHGIVLKELEEINYDFDLLIVPDAGSSDFKQLKYLNEMIKDVLILDHHNFDVRYVKQNFNSNTSIVIINNQDGLYENPTLSGVGVVYKFFNLYEKLLNYPNYSDDMLDLVAIGMIGDCMSLKNFETRYLCLKGIELLNNGKGNKFIREIYEKLKGRIGEEVTIKKIGWNIVPLFNAMVRSGKQEEKEDTFKALIELNETRIYQPKKRNGVKPPEEVQTIQKYMARVLTNVKGRQDRLITKQFNVLNDKIKENNLMNNKVIIINATDELESTFTGYVANKISSYYKRPSLVLKQKDENTFGGSGRNYELFEVDNFAELLARNTKIKTQGHNNAFGLKVKKDDIKESIEKLNSALKNVKIEDVYHVDYCIPVGRLKEKQIRQVGKFESIWGNDLDAPLFCIKDIYVDLSNIKLLGEKENVLSITKTIGNNTIKFIKTIDAKKAYNKILGKKGGKGLSVVKTKSGKVCLEIIGEFTINKWKDYESPQVNVIDFNIINKKREIKF